MDDGTGSATLDDVLAHVDTGLSDLATVGTDGFDTLAGQVSDVIVRLDRIEGAQDTSGTASTVTLDSQQLEHLESGMRVVASTTFVAMCLLGALAGLAVWQIMTRVWRG